MSKRRKPHQAVVSIYTHAFANGWKIHEVCRVAQVAPSTWTRLAQGGTPNLSTLDKLISALDQLIATETESDGTESGREAQADT